MTFCLTSGGAGSDALMPLTMRPTGLGSGIDKDRQDYTIYSGEWAVGRIYETRGGPDHLRWFWSFTVTCPMARSGRVPTLEEAKAQFRNSWDAWKALGEAGGGGLKKRGARGWVPDRSPIASFHYLMSGMLKR